MLGKWLMLGGIVLAALVYGNAAQAEGGSCPDGYYPVGGGNAGWQGCNLIPTSGEPAPSSGPRVPRYIDNYIAVAWHPKANDVWATWNHRTEEKSTQKALNACKEVMGEGCTIAVNGWNGSVAIARDQNNAVWQAWGNTPENARRKVLNACEEKKVSCQILHLFTAEPIVSRGIFTKKQKSHFPQKISQPFAERGFFAIAWAGLSPQAWPNLVVASGYPTAKEAEKVAIERCQAESKQTCFSFGVVDDRTHPMFAAYIYGKDQAYWYSNTTEKSLEKDADKHCREGGVSCQKVGVFDARRSGISIHPIKQ